MCCSFRGIHLSMGLRLRKHHKTGDMHHLKKDEGYWWHKISYGDIRVDSWHFSLLWGRQKSCGLLVIVSGLFLWRAEWVGIWLWNQGLGVQFPTVHPIKASLGGLGLHSPKALREEGNSKPLLSTLYLGNPGKRCQAQNWFGGTEWWLWCT